uniref:Glutamate decarboxylase 1 n=1 Tax=Equus caballus TaxID=9796 RepID=A0A9L0SHU4_HORSE
RWIARGALPPAVSPGAPDSGSARGCSPGLLRPGALRAAAVRARAERGYLAASGNHLPVPALPRGALPVLLCFRPLDPGSGEDGFLQRTNSLEEKSRLVSAFKERQSSKNLLSCENSDRDGRFRRTETDFSNLFARDLLPAKNGEEQTVQFLLEVVDILLNYVRKTFDRSTKVLDFHHPHQLLEGMEGFNLELSDHPESLEQILVDCRDTLKYGVRTGHPRFFNQLSTGLDIIGLAGEWLTSTANTNMGSYIQHVQHHGCSIQVLPGS